MAKIYLRRKDSNTIVASFKFKHSKARTNFKNLEDAKGYYYSHGLRQCNLDIRREFATVAKLLKTAEFYKAVLLGVEQRDKVLFVTLSYPNKTMLERSLLSLVN